MKKRFMTYAGNHKGVTLVLMALILVVLLILASLAIDIAYMYYTKNQLQVAADAAALAGAAQLDQINTTSFVQAQARQQAWKFACKNKAAGSAVFLVTNLDANGGSNCDLPPLYSNLNGTLNSENGDIVVGNWNFQTRQFSTENISMSNPINAVKITARRTGETPGMDRVGLFLGKIFGWSVMSVNAGAIAAQPPRASSFVAVGNEFCPPAGSPVCVGATGSIFPNTCNLVTPRELEVKPTTAPNSHKLGWTSLLDRPGSTNLFEELMCSVSPYQEICSSSGIWGIPGTSAATFKDFQSLMCDPSFDSGNKEIHPITRRITGWEVLIPIVDRADPMSAPDPNPVWGHAKIRIIAICAPGAAGCRGEGSCASSSYCTGGDKKVVVDRISCIGCGTNALGLKAVLVD